MYSLVASVVPRNGLLNRKENTMIGWTSATIIVVMNMAFHFRDYASSQSYLHSGSYYHCWLDYATGSFTIPRISPMMYLYKITGLMYGQLGPILFLTLTTLVIIEASGAATDTISYPSLKGTNKDQVFLNLGAYFVYFIYCLHGS